MRKFFLLILAILSVFFIQKSVYAQSQNQCIDDVDINSAYLNSTVSTEISTGGKYSSVDVCVNQTIILINKALNGKCSLTPSQTATIRNACELWQSGNQPTPIPLYDTPSPTPGENPNCGNKDSACCKGNPTQIQAGSYASDPNSKKNCFFICPQDLFGWIGDVLTGSIGEHNTELTKLGYCKTVNIPDGTAGGKILDLVPVPYDTPGPDETPIPNLTPGDCICKEISADTNSAQLCQQYIATAYGNLSNSQKNVEKAQAEMKACVTCSFGEAPSPVPTISGFLQISYHKPPDAVNGGVWTGMGCIYAGNKTKFIENNLMPIALGLGGIIAMLCIAFAAVTFQTSAGNPEKVKNAQQMMTSCIAGLILIIFSIFILRLIGVDILGLPGLGK